MITVFLSPLGTAFSGKHDPSAQKFLEYSRDVKKINCIVNVPVSYAKGIPTCKKKLEILARAGIRTIEDLFEATEKTLSALKDESFFYAIQTACENVQKHTFIRKESMLVPRHLCLNRKLKHKEDHLIQLGISIFDPIFKNKKIARNALLERIPKEKEDRIEKKKKFGSVRKLRTHKLTYKKRA